MTSRNVRLDLKSNLIGTAPRRTARTYINLLIYEDYGNVFISLFVCPYVCRYMCRI